MPAPDSVQTKQRRDRTEGIVARPSTAQKDDLDAFLASFSDTVAEAAAIKVAAGKAAFKPEGIPVGSLLEIQLREKAAEVGAAVPEARGMPAAPATSQAPSRDDAASVYSVASSMVSMLRRARENGVVEEPPALFVEAARGRAEMKPTRAQRLWHAVRYDINSPVKILMDNKTRDGLAGAAMQVAPVAQGSDRLR